MVAEQFGPHGRGVGRHHLRPGHRDGAKAFSGTTLTASGDDSYSLARRAELIGPDTARWPSKRAR